MKTYKEQFDKLTTAYINLGVNPFSGCKCYVGNLLGSGDWSRDRDYCIVVNASSPLKDAPYGFCRNKVYGDYHIMEILRLERVFLTTYIRHNNGIENFYSDEQGWRLFENNENTTISQEEYFIQQEEALFKAFEAANTLLRKIHQEHGQNVDAQFEFTKRQKCVSI